MFLKNPDLPGDGNPGGLLRCAHIVSDVLGAESCAVIAGMALSAFGYVRGTLEPDFISRDYPAGGSQGLVDIANLVGVRARPPGGGAQDCGNLRAGFNSGLVPEAYLTQEGKWIFTSSAVAEDNP